MQPPVSDARKRIGTAMILRSLHHRVPVRRVDRVDEDPNTAGVVNIPNTGKGMRKTRRRIG